MGLKPQALYAQLMLDKDKKNTMKEQRGEIEKKKSPEGLGGLEVLDGDKGKLEPLIVRNCYRHEYILRYCSRAQRYLPQERFEANGNGVYNSVCLGCDAGKGGKTDNSA